MATSIRLMRFGKKGHAQYRIVVLDKTKKAKGPYIELLGTYDPHVNPPAIVLKKDRFSYWRSVGAQISHGLSKIEKLLV